MWNLIKLTNKQNRNRLTENRPAAIRGEGGRGLGDKGEGVKQRKKPHRHTMVCGRRQKRLKVG